MANHDIVVVGASAGGVEALQHLVQELPEDLPAALLVVVHLPSNAHSVMPKILTRAGKLTAVQPRDGETIYPGRIYVAPPDRHLLVEQDHMRVLRGPQESGHRPAVDPLFRTAARAYGPRVVGVILSGTDDDGSAGLLVIKERGGIAIAKTRMRRFLEKCRAMRSSWPESTIFSRSRKSPPCSSAWRMNLRQKEGRP